MKDNNSMLHGGKLKPEYYETWGWILRKLIQAYEKEGIPIWGLTVTERADGQPVLGVLYLHG